MWRRRTTVVHRQLRRGRERESFCNLTCDHKLAVFYSVYLPLLFFFLFSKPKASFSFIWLSFNGSTLESTGEEGRVKQRGSLRCYVIKMLLRLLQYLQILTQVGEVGVSSRLTDGGASHWP